MLYSEFIKGTGCRDNEKNYQIYKDLEVMYMNSDLSKEQIYEYGKKLVDNSKSESQIKFENKLNDEIQELKNDINYYNNLINHENDNIEYFTKYYNNPDYVKDSKHSIKEYKKQIRILKIRIKNIRFILNQA